MKTMVKQVAVIAILTLGSIGVNATDFLPFASTGEVTFGDVSPNVESVTPAEYPGGESAMVDYFVSRVKYPAQAKDQRLNGEIVVAVTIDEFGTTGNIEIVKGLWGGFEQEVVDAIESMPHWKPAELAGKPVATTKYFYFNFQL